MSGSKDGVNLSKEQLSQIRYLKGEIEILKDQIINLDCNIVSDTVTGSDDEFPYSKRIFPIIGIEDYTQKIKTMQLRLQKRVDRFIELVEQANAYVESIDDSLIRQIIILRHVNGFTWSQVAAHVGGGNTADSVRMLHDRFLKSV